LRIGGTKAVAGREELLEHLGAITGLDAGTLEKIVQEIHLWFEEDLHLWLERRHRELQHQGLKNREIYPRLLEEARSVLVRPGSLSLRQIRRALYG
jgi:hypothetical protein